MTEPTARRDAALPICIFGCGKSGMYNMSDARHEGIGYACIDCIIRAARKKYIERQIKADRKAAIHD